MFDEWRRTLSPRIKEAKFNIYRLRKNPLSLIGIVMMSFFIVLAIVAPLLAEPNRPNPFKVPTFFSTEPLPPSQEHPFGTTGPPGYYDVFYGVVWGTRISLRISFTVITSALIIGVTLGGLAGIYGGKIEEVIMRVTDIFLALPGLLLAMAIASVLGRNIYNLTNSLIVVWWPVYARVIRAEILRIKSETFVEAARANGCSTLRIIQRHILPNVIYPVVVVASLDMGRVVLMAASLSFLGLGAQPGTAEWGLIISEGRNWMLRGMWWTTLFPGLAIFGFVLGWNFIGDAFRDILDPTVRRHMI